jgi:hypothetical protein
VGFQQQLLDFTEIIIQNRMRHYTGLADPVYLYDKATSQAIRQSKIFAGIFRKAPVTDEELVILLLALMPHLQPAFYPNIIQEFFPEGGDFPEFGGVKGTNHRGILPTGETAIFVLAGNHLEKRLKIQALLSHEAWLFQSGIIQLETVKTGEPVMSGRLLLDEEVVEALTLGKVSPPRFSNEFAAERLTTEQEWADLVLNEHTRQQIQDIHTWLQHNDTLLFEWGMFKKSNRVTVLCSTVRPVPAKR